MTALHLISYLLSLIYYLLSLISPPDLLPWLSPQEGIQPKQKKGRLDLRKHLRTISTDHVRICLTCAQSLCVKEHLWHPNTMGYGMLRKKGILSVEHIKSPRRRLSCITAVLGSNLLDLIILTAMFRKRPSDGQAV